MTTARRRALVGLLSLALVASAQAGMATSAIAADAPAGTAAVGTTAVTFTTAPQPSITGTAQVGSTLFAVTGTWAPQPDSFTFKWWSNGVAISGATGSAYTLVAADAAKKITLTVTANKSGYTSLAKSSAATATVAAAPSPVAFTTIPTPTITGTPKVGTPLTAAPGTWAPVPTTFAYRWFVANVAVTGATGSTYTPVAADVGKRITVTVTGSRSGYTTAAKTSAASAAVVAAPVTTPSTFTTVPTPTLSGTAQVGSTLTAAPGTWAPVPTTFSYRWFVANVAVPGATASTYAPVAADLGKRITVTVTGARSGYTSASKTSAASAAVVASPAAKAFAVASSPTITGTVAVGGVLTAATGSWSPAPAFSYQWSAGSTAISGATGSTYTLGTADLGKTITVTITAKATGYITTTRTSAATAAVGKPAITSAQPVIVGDAKVGQTLRVVPNAWAPRPAFTYVWYANDVKISGATAQDYTPMTADIGKRITATAIGTATGYTTTARTSAKTAAVVAANVELPQQPWTGRVVGNVYLDSMSPQNLITEGSIALEPAGFPDGGGWDITADGFTITDVEPGEYALHAFVPVAGDYLIQYYGQTNEIDDAQTFAVLADSTVRVDVVLKRYASISGTATSAAGEPVAGVSVQAFRAGGDGRFEDYTTTDDNGRYTLRNIEPGQYKVQFGAYSSPEDGFLEEWYGETDDRAAATVVSVPQWGQAAINVSVKLDAGARMYGSVSGAGGSRLADARVYLVPTSSAVQGIVPSSARSVSTDQWGSFSITGLDAGDYYVYVSADRASAPAYTAQWVGGTGTLATASVYRATRGTQMSSVYAQLAVSPSVTASVTGLAAAGWDSDYAVVNLYQGGVIKYSGYSWYGAGAFIKDIAPGTYQVAVTYHRGEERKAYWWNGGVYADKSEIVVRAGDSISIVAKAITRVAPAGARLVR
ncbi:carboxypeptidase regulatory-like domain-containing protein [Clavibacter michiganensis]|uniref:alpha-amylase n=1 Tax=Clavibacter michiganensis subsp. insidiosus TaxID=33014 RepID=A0A399N419_9MICO|nr:carboxypeptidase regulatory-like domain-containing protein [Clavibacter michiganensis]AWF99561.1 hypothetical protein BEH61_13720 [Clavibacter michiganensis subsp. insidiosus]AWG00320.1 hypothetical protein BEH62_01755 [Clavibacter michiganensis subsp. insidiosus]OQJ61041.1 hypothetical protein B5P21_14815 [Clavibacter michiganensis subsp. insidiosus]RII87656.1 carboxypeptidase regulatory-like domain-containing protein [Clavibacter michiganensis subsp. insidiosus]RIJ43963.1 carboxypeptidase